MRARFIAPALFVLIAFAGCGSTENPPLEIESSLSGIYLVGELIVNSDDCATAGRRPLVFSGEPRVVVRIVDGKLVSADCGDLATCVRLAETRAGAFDLSDQGM